MSDRHALAALFQELTVLLELGGENPFKIRAIAGAVRTLESETRSLREIAADPPKGFGKGLVEKVEEFLKTGALRDLETWRQQIPGGMLDLLDVQGLGPKKVRQLYHEVGILAHAAPDVLHVLEQLPHLHAEVVCQVLQGDGLQAHHLHHPLSPRHLLLFHRHALLT